MSNSRRGRLRLRYGYALAVVIVLGLIGGTIAVVKNHGRVPDANTTSDRTGTINEVTSGPKTYDPWKPRVSGEATRPSSSSSLASRSALATRIGVKGVPRLKALLRTCTMDRFRIAEARAAEAPSLANCFRRASCSGVQTFDRGLMPPTFHYR